MNSLVARVLVICFVLISQNAFSLTNYTHQCIETPQENSSIHCEQSQPPLDGSGFSPSHCDKDCVCPFLNISFYGAILETNYLKPIPSTLFWSRALHLAIPLEPSVPPPITHIFYS